MSLLEIEPVAFLWVNQNYDPRLSDYKHRLLNTVHLERSTPLGPYFGYVFDFEASKIAYLDESFSEVCGYPKEFVNQKPREFLQQVLPETYQFPVLNALTRVWRHCLNLPLELRNQLRASLDFCMVFQNGSIRRALLEVSNVILDNLGSPVYMAGRCSDINHWGPCHHVTLVLEDPLNFQKQKFPLSTTHQINLLSKREREILSLLAAGYSSKSIANSLAISYHTVNTHRQNMLSKLGIRKTTGLIRLALVQGLI